MGLSSFCPFLLMGELCPKERLVSDKDKLQMGLKTHLSISSRGSSCLRVLFLLKWRLFMVDPSSSQPRRSFQSNTPLHSRPSKREKPACHVFGAQGGAGRDCVYSLLTTKTNQYRSGRKAGSQQPRSRVNRFQHVQGTNSAAF